MLIIKLLEKHTLMAIIKGTGLFTFCLLICLALPGSSVSMEASAQANQSTTTDQRVAVLVFHAVAEEPANPNTMRPKDLEETFQALMDGGYHPISLEQFHAFIKGQAEVPPRAVLLTFDDGYSDVYKVVLPLTKRYNYPAVVFAVSKWFDRYPRPENSREHLSVEEAKELLSSGLWQIGGHSYDGHRLIIGSHSEAGAYLVTRRLVVEDFRLESEAEYRARVWQDINLNTIALKLAGVTEPKDFAFPYGAFNADLVKMLNEAGYTYLYTNIPGLNEPGQDPSYICRISAGRNAEETIAVLEKYSAQNNN
ncbi:MAG: Poly-beta-1,6-N-acetyl-D-glucosamine N-deacetylase precursor [Pelotomaculum sp. PtaB.Bin013]|uniref:Polysaccharide deacetylase family protein n=1 Tax=Pelotomaculum isophthalicicum JI TaxID=947010 RepID=A0A9X4JTR5_9FIRM|nr:polysaccharide deacetylase family protein [Pelotomaculum isophthalicicum]MDF9409174.1 polysaccharide deacetylase family protein [Pelotomaculum isophthalicicum JI]OPX90326.1 MAG: Poly-beta-1,6-N-acetyl-D-glucosamine N-deacetylase precursor [Pelotomaculum sp. PtaB.Bin013]